MSGPRPVVAAATCAVGLGVAMFDNTAVLVALPALGESFGSSVSGLQWVAATAALAAAAVLPFSGALGDRFGARRAVRLGLGVFALAVLAAAASPSLPALLAARVFQGAGIALMLPNGAALLQANVSDAARSRTFGTWISVSSIGLIAGPLAGGWLVSELGWRSIFLVPVPFALLGILGTLRLRERRDGRPAGRLDLAGSAVAGTGLALLCWSLIEFGRSDGDAWWATGCLVASALVFAALVPVERRAPTPAVDLALLRNRTYVAIMVSCLLYNATTTGGAFLVSLLLQDVRGFGAVETGLIILVATVGMPFGGRLTGRLAQGGSLRRLMAGAITVLALAYVLVAALALGPLAWIAAPLLLTGFASGVLYSGDTLAVLGTVDPGKTASGLASLSLVRQVGAVLGIAVLGSLSALAERIQLVDLGLRAGLLVAGLSVVPGILLLLRHLPRPAPRSP
ncbi:MFS transporter [Nonomuraea sp. MCN248]|uniref:MFS transporter n=1 Tax=Nonomuraea corallina TaxID=2989783 RepID=A0ABT4SH58_9ACTN|nr:MFS transporter [Nonomuraea corallina]MDA0636315.1 MFS transporter [Nonomuraea corallina]